MKRIRWGAWSAVHTDRVLAVCALATAVVSIAVSLWMGMETRHHNRLSVRPRLDITFNAGGQSLGYEVTNHGLGPALVTGLDVRLDGREQTRDGIRGYQDLLGLLGTPRESLVVDALGSGSMLPAGESRRIFAVRMDGAASRDSRLREVYSRTSVVLRYESMYREAFVTRLP